MAITNPEAIKFVNEVVRPFAEQFRAMKARSDAAMIQWYAGLNTVITNTSDIVEDGREAQGISRLTGADVTNLVSQIGAFKSQLDSSGFPQVIAKPCVRPIEVVG